MNSHLGSSSPDGLPQLHRAIANGKTPPLEECFTSLESYWSLNVQNGIAWPIRTSATQVMAKRKVGSQISSLTPDHGKSRIDPILLCVGGVQQTIIKISTRATTSVEIPSQSEVCTRSYSLAKLWESQPWWFRDCYLGVRGQKPFGCHSHRVV
jgi:hypothetical protein